MYKKIIFLSLIALFNSAPTMERRESNVLNRSFSIQELAKYNMLPPLEGTISLLDHETYESVNLSGKQIQNLDGLDIYGNNLRSIDLSNNNLTKIPAGLFSKFKKLSKVNLANNTITELSGFNSDLPELAEINLSLNPLKKIDEQFLEGCNPSNYCRILVDKEVAAIENLQDWEERHPNIDFYYSIKHTNISDDTRFILYANDGSYFCMSYALLKRSGTLRHMLQAATAIATKEIKLDFNFEQLKYVVEILKLKGYTSDEEKIQGIKELYKRFNDPNGDIFLSINDYFQMGFKI